MASVEATDDSSVSQNGENHLGDSVCCSSKGPEDQVHGCFFYPLVIMTPDRVTKS